MYSQEKYGDIIKSAGITEYKTDENLSGYCSYGTGGNCDVMFFPKNGDEFKNLLRALKDKTDFFYLGNGTNVLVGDNGYEGAVINTRKLNNLDVNGRIITAEAGVLVKDVINLAVNSSLGGLEFLSGLPATVGGAVAMNAGCFDKTVGDSVAYVVTADKVYNRQDCCFGYRKSRFTENCEGIISVGFSLINSEYETVLSKTDYYRNLRRNKHPAGRSCGSVFKNDGYFAGKVIENAELKGIRIGGARVSDKHANFIIAENGATSADIYNLINFIKETVKKKLDINLTEEIRYIGKF